MTQWLIRECREPGKEGRVWELTRKGLSVGRSSDCDIQLLSQTVEQRHAVFEWHHKKEVFVIRDLGSLNGTYLNSQLLRNTFGMVEHGSSVRFGYERDHTFRLEMIKSLQTPTSSNVAPSNMASSNVAPSNMASSSVTSSNVAPSSVTSSNMASSSVTSSNMASSSVASSSVASSNVASTQTSPPEPEHQRPTSIGQETTVQYVPIPSQPPAYVIPAMQPVSYIMQQPLAFGYPPATIVTPVHQYMQHPTMSPVNFHTMSPAYQIPIATPPVTHPEHGAEEETPVRPRKDGRRSISLSDAPNLSKGTPLYGNPAWWGEEDPMVGYSDEETASSSPRILRDLEPDRPRSAGRVVELNRTWRGSVGHELRKQAISNRTQERGSDSPTSWVVKLDPVPRASRRLDTERRPRSADPSPTRRRSDIPFVRRSVSPGPSPRQSPVPDRKNTTVSKKKKSSRKPPAKKPPSGATPTSKARPEQKGFESPMSARVEPFSWNESHSSQGSPSYHLPRKCPSDTHMTTDTTYIISEIERPSSARKQWTNEQPQAPDNLMLASIEARMRRLSKMAQTTAQTVSSLKHALMAVVAPEPPSSSPAPPVPTEQDLPEWKFFNKDVDSIFRNIRTVERWLREIDSTSVSLQLLQGTREEVDYGKEYLTESESEVFPDSVEDMCHSSGTEDP